MNRLRFPALSLIAACLLGSTANAATPGNDPAALAKVRDTALQSDYAYQRLEDLADLVGAGTLGVITPHTLLDRVREVVDGVLTDRVAVLTVPQAKGLEFDGVVLVEPAAIASESVRGGNDLYVAITRATQRLHVLHASPLPPGLERG